VTLHSCIVAAVKSTKMPKVGAGGGEKKNYTEALSHSISQAVAEELRTMGLDKVSAPGRGPDKQFMGGYGTKGVDVYLADEKHGLLLTSGVKGLIFDPRKNLKNRYRDMVMEALELHKRFPYAVCGHLFFLGRNEALKAGSKFGTTLGEAVALLSTITGRERPEDAPELYETMGILLLEPGEPDSVDLEPKGVPPELCAAGYCDRLAGIFHSRNPFYT
jgi:hypothetical protein